MATDQQQPVLPDKCPIFEWSPGIPIDDHEQDPVQEDNVYENEEAVPIANEQFEIADETGNFITDDDNTIVEDESV